MEDLVRRSVAGAAAALALSLSVVAAATAAPGPQPYETNDAGGFLNILPPGQNGHADAGQVIFFSGISESPFGSGSAPRPPHASDQLDLYEDLVFASPTLSAGRLRDFYKDAGFGVREDDVAKRYSPRDDVTIVRDKSFGVPHIYGEDRAGAMFGAGYVGAEDRLFEMDVLRHAGRAQLSSFVGGAEGNKAMDRDQWRVAPYREEDLQLQFDLGDEVYGEAGRALQEDVTNYVAGINKYICEAQPLRPDCSAAQRRQIEGNNGSTPAEKLPGGYGAIAPNGLPGEQPLPRLWKVTDVIATASLIGGIFGKGGGREVDAAKVLEEAIARFGGQGRAVFGDFRRAEDAEAPTTASGAFPYRVPPTSVDPDSVGLPDAGTLADSPVLAGSGGSGSGLPGGIFGLLGGASNALLVAADESESGRPVTVFGPQTGYFSPQLLMEIDIHAPPSRAANGSPRQGIDARGATFAGVNLYVQLGRGRNYAWSATSAGQDIVDTFALELCDPPGGATDGYRFRGSCLEFEVLERQNQWFPNGADQSAPGSETLRTRRSKLGLEVARGEIGGVPHVYVLLRSTYFHEADSALGFVDFNDPERMATPQGFEQAASKIGFTFNWFYANRDDVAYFNSGNNPVRKGASDPSFPVRACPDESDPCDFEWQGWDPDSTGASPNKFVADYTPPEQHPQTLNPAFITSWNNKQAPQYRAADDNFSYGPVHRSQPLDDRIRAGIAGGAKMSLAELVDAMEDAGTVDLRGDKVLPFALRVLRSEPESDAALRDAITALDAWRAGGAHRRDRDDDGVYEHNEAIKIMDAWWPRWIEAQFKPALGAGLYDALVSMMGLDDEPGPIGSAYINGWYGYAQKDLRTLLGDDPPDAFSRTYCGAADQSDTASLAKCRAVLRDALADAVAASEASVYPDGSCEDEDGSQQSAQYCQDAIEHTAVGAITQPPIHWVNRPTFQQAVEVGARRAQGTGVKDEPEEGETLASGPQDAPDVGGNARRRVPAPSASGDLPFTGFLVAVVALAGAAALLGGRALRRRLR